MKNVMVSLPKIDEKYLEETLVDLLNIPSPTGFSVQAIQFLEEKLQEFPFLEFSQTRKGALVATWEGENNDAPRGLTAHVDTLGAMVKEIKSNGRLKMTKIGGFAWNTVEGEGVTVYSSQGQEREPQQEQLADRPGSAHKLWKKSDKERDALRVQGSDDKGRPKQGTARALLRRRLNLHLLGFRDPEPDPEVDKIESP